MFSALKKIMNPVAPLSTITRENDSCAAISGMEACRQKMSVGDLDGAERDARSVLAISANNGDAWYHMGMIAYRRGDYDGALEMLRSAAELSPMVAEIQNHYGNALRSHGHFDEALERYRKAAELKSDYAAPLYNMGLIKTARGRILEATLLFEQSTAIDPFFSPALISLGRINLNQNNFQAAERYFRAALDSTPESLEACNNLAIVLTKLKRCDEALELCKRGLVIATDSAELHNTIGIALTDTGRFDEAIASYRRALELNPVNPLFLNNLGSALRAIGNITESISSIKGALTLKPDYVVAWHNLGLSLRQQGKLEDAVNAYHRSLDLFPTNAAVFNDLGGALVAQGETEAAVAAYRNAFESDPHFYIACSNMLLTMQYSPSYSAIDIYQESRRYEVICGILPKLLHSNDPDPNRKLRIGYVSPDFRRHSVSYFFQTLFANQSRSEFAIFCYSDVLVPDEHTNYYRKNSDCWQDIRGVSDEKVANLMAEDRIDILVDLAGHTSPRLSLFALKPAPVQITWLGYPDTTGLQAMDYRFSDDLADPEGDSDRYCTERIYRLPGGFLCYTPPLDAPEVALLPSYSSGIVTFGSFNNISKITPQVIEQWCNILKRLPASRLVIKNHSLADSFVRKRYLALFSARGIPLGRVELRPWLEDTGSHLAVYGEIDIALDTFPYNGTTTTCEALWMGVPVVTLSGERHAGRVGASILSRVGLADLVAESTDAYLDIAETLSCDINRLATIRNTLRNSMLSSSLCNGAAFTTTVENAYRLFWRGWCDERLKSN